MNGRRQSNQMKLESAADSVADSSSVKCDGCIHHDIASALKSFNFAVRPSTIVPANADYDASNAQFEEQQLRESNLENQSTEDPYANVHRFCLPAW